MNANEVIDAAIKIAEEYEKKAYEIPMEQRAVVLSTYITEIKEKLLWMKNEIEQ